MTNPEVLLEQARAWLADDPEPSTQAELSHLIDRVAAGDADAQADLADRFSGTLQFGTAGLRGALGAGPNRMNRSVVIRAAAGLSAYLNSVLPALAHSDQAPHIVVGYDARHFSEAFAYDSAAVWVAAGCRVSILNRALPTPVLAYTMRRLGADAGVVVTASHNPPADNGYKVYLGGRVVLDEGKDAQIVPPFDQAIADQIAAVPSVAPTPRAEAGWTVLGEEAVTSYIDAVHTLIDDAPRDLNIVLTPLHGVGGQVVEDMFEGAGFTNFSSVPEQVKPDPDFPTVSFPNPEEPGAIDLALAHALKRDADIVIANDPDTDRCAVAIKDPRVTGTPGTPQAAGWRMLHGDEVGAILGDHLARTHLHSDPDSEEPATLANSIVSSRLLGEIAQHYGLNYRATLTGFKWISRAPHLLFGYEEALGYCVAPDLVRDKDGISAALIVAQLAARLKAQGSTSGEYLDSLAKRHGLYQTDQLSARFTDLSQIPATMARLRATPPATLAGSPVTEVVDLSAGSASLPPTDGIVLLAEDGTRVIVRPSGTEPKVKCYLEVIAEVHPGATFDKLTSVREQARAALDQVRVDVGAALGI